MTEQTIQNLDIKNLIEENNVALRNAIRALENLHNQILQQPNDQMIPRPAPLPSNSYPGYTTPPRFGFMSNEYK